jgi:hypothetical protein
MDKAARAARRFRSIVLLALFLVSPVFAGELGLLINGNARHINAPADANFNERNWGAGLQYDFAPRDERWVPFLTASGFRDSYKRPSYYAGGGMMRRYEFAPQLGLHVDVGAVMFLMTREDYKYNKPFFGVLPVFSLGTRQLALNVSYVPKVHPKMTSLVFFQLKVKLAEF